MSGLVSVLVVPEAGDARKMALERRQLPTLVRGGFRELVEPGDAVFEYDTRKLLFRDDRLRARDTVSDRVEGLDAWVVARPSSAAKCVRCWHYRADVGSHADDPELCGRCVENVNGAGESRRWF